MTRLDYGHSQKKLLELLIANNLSYFDKPLSSLTGSDRPVKLVDIGCCYGNTSLSFTCGWDWAETTAFWKGKVPLAQCRKKFDVTGVDISQNALAFGLETQIYDRTILADVNSPWESQPARLKVSLRKADVLLMAQCSCYLDVEAMRNIFAEFCSEEIRPKLLVYDHLTTFDDRDLTSARLLPECCPHIVLSGESKHRDLTEEERTKLKLEQAMVTVYLVRF